MKTLTAMKILLIVTSHTQLGNTKEPTGFWFEELAAPYAEFTQAGAQVDIASPLGGKARRTPRARRSPPRPPAPSSPTPTRRRSSRTRSRWRR
ncbi:hypothetical protein ACN28S_61295 [Cystobacter fuscus]